MNWTNEKPVKPGYYWLKKPWLKHIPQKSIVRFDNFCIHGITDKGIPLEKMHKDCLWAGPIDEPEGEKNMKQAYIKRLALILAEQAEIEGMKAENIIRGSLGYSLAYGDAAFYAKADRFRELAAHDDQFAQEAIQKDRAIQQSVETGCPVYVDYKKSCKVWRDINENQPEGKD